MVVHLADANPAPHLVTPTVVQGGLHDWSVGAKWVHEWDYGVNFALPLPSFQPYALLHDAATDPDGLPMNGQVLFVGNTGLFQVGNYSEDAIMSFDGTATHDLIRFPHDKTRGAENIGTDGLDMVWTLGENRPVNQPVYPTRSIYTSPYTTESTKLAPRRLRSDPSAEFGLEEAQFAVGCGFAGRVISATDNVEIVRLSDGVGWILQGTKDWKWIEVLGFTCDEAIVEAIPTVPGTFALARVKLDSLGTALPPD